MYNTFNMGIGFILAVSKEDADRALEIIKGTGEQAYIIGECVSGERKIEIV